MVAYALVSVVGFLTMAFKGIGKFAQPFFPWDVSPETYGLVIMLVTGVYCVVGGMYSVVLNDLIQYALIFAGALIIAGVALFHSAGNQVLRRRAGRVGSARATGQADAGLVATHPLLAGPHLRRGRRRLCVLRVLCGHAVVERRVGEHGGADTKLRNPAHSLDAESAGGCPGKPHDGAGIARARVF